MEPVTIFTPAYQRKETLPRLYASLRAQTSKAFEWIVIDDGSTDGTAELLSRWSEKETAFPIRWKTVPHGGKHRGINRAVQMAQYEPFFIVDSDDYLAQDAIENVQAWFEEIASDDTFAGVSGLKAHFDGRIIGGDGGGKVVDATCFEREEKDLLWDHSEVYKTSILKRFPFPEFPGEDFIGEGIVWDAIALAGYKLRWHPVIMYYCEYRSDGLTCNARKRDQRNPLGMLAYIRLARKYRSPCECGWRLLFWQHRFRHTPAMQELSAEDRDDMRVCVQDLKSKLHDFFASNGVRILALYGMGLYGRCFLELVPSLGISISYGLDRKAASLPQKDTPVYLPDQELPKADAVLVTMAQYEKNLDAWLKERYPFVIWLLNLIKDGAK